MKPPNRGGRNLIVFTPHQIQKVNFLWYTNARNITDISKVLGYSVPVVERNIFPTRSQWEEWERRCVLGGRL
jgi:hypothetical protein